MRSRRRFRSPRGFAALICLWAVAAAGCHEEGIGYTEVKRLDETLTERDFADLVAVLKRVDEKDRRRLPNPFLPPPRWRDDRTLPVAELLQEERVTTDRAWEPERAEAAVPSGPAWDKALKSRALTRAQFASLVLSAAAALGRLEADPRVDLPALAARGEDELAALAAEERTFASLSPEERHAVLERAAWLATSDRAARLATVPAENVAAVKTRREELSALLPAAFFRDPFDGLYPRPSDFGVPFDEGDVSDADLTWSPDEAIIGTDPPDDVRNAGAAGSRH